MLHAISPVDGRYAEKTAALQQYFSEAALIKYRVMVEIEYLVALSETGIIPKAFSAQQISDLRDIARLFSDADAAQIREIEGKINHDVKAVEYFIKEKLSASGLEDYKEWVHFGLTSQDINNSAFPLMIRAAYADVLVPMIKSLRNEIASFAEETKGVAMMAYTHGQPASPTRLGKEVIVFVERLDRQIDTLQQTELKIKFGGATGNFNAHSVAFPDKDWHAWADQFARHYLKIERYRYTTQIEHYDQLAALCHVSMRINTILIDLCRDIWTYISMNYLSQRSNPNEVGSSAMPHKVNPIDFENAEGNLGYANSIFGYLADKLPVSRLQRDLTDSTVLRNIGVPVAHSYIALQSIRKGFKKVLPNRIAIEADLEDNWIVIAEAIQTVLRKEGIANPYELLKDLTRGKDHIGREELHAFIQQLAIAQHVKEQLLALTPAHYTGQ